MNVKCIKMADATRGGLRIYNKTGVLNINDGRMVFVTTDNAFIGGNIVNIVFSSSNTVVITIENNQFTFELI